MVFEGRFCPTKIENETPQQSRRRTAPAEAESVLQSS